MSYTGALRNALTEWAPTKMKAIPGPLFLILIDHGSPETFYLTGEQPLTAQTLKGWLDALQNQTDGIMWKNPETGENEPPPVVVILGACYSGSFIDDLSAPGRIVVTASTENEPSYRGAYNPYSKVRDGEFFTSALFNGLGAGLGLKASFENAVTQTETHTDNGKGNLVYPWSDKAAQHPLLEDNGDGKSSNNLAISGSDGDQSEHIVLGSGTGVAVKVTTAGTVPETSGTPLSASVNEAILWATVSESIAGKSEVWVEIRKPDMILEQQSENQQIVDLISIPLKWQESEERYEAVYSNFSVSGEYFLFFYAKDASGIISPFQNNSLHKDKQRVKGDVNGDAIVNLSDAILSLKIASGANVGNAVITIDGDVNGDGKIGIEEAVYILRILTGL